MRRAGNLFGTTRICHPGPLGNVPASRTARISSGVRPSWPEQKAHGPALWGRTGAEEKSEGRRDRSVEMITQRPTTGSRLSSGTDGLLLLGARLACEQRGEGLPHGLTFEEHRRHLVADRHAHLRPPGENPRRAHRAHALRADARGRFRLGPRPRVRDGKPKTVVGSLRN